MIRHGEPPFLECSSRGDIRFSAFGARIKSRGNKMIEAIYQGSKVFEDGTTGCDWRTAKKRGTPVNVDYVRRLYSQLWDEYIAENEHLLPIILNASGLSDMFGQQGHACQATELWRIRSKHISTSTSDGEKHDHICEN